jgi:hypothetical protein
MGCRAPRVDAACAPLAGPEAQPGVWTAPPGASVDRPRGRAQRAAPRGRRRARGRAVRSAWLRVWSCRMHVWLTPAARAVCVSGAGVGGGRPTAEVERPQAGQARGVPWGRPRARSVRGRRPLALVSLGNPRRGKRPSAGRGGAGGHVGAWQDRRGRLPRGSPALAAQPPQASAGPRRPPGWGKEVGRGGAELPLVRAWRGALRATPAASPRSLGALPPPAACLDTPA